MSAAAPVALASTPGLPRSLNSPDVSGPLDILHILLERIGCPATAATMVKALVGLADNRTDFFQAADFEVGKRLPDKTGGKRSIEKRSIAKKAQRYRAKLDQWQTAERWTLVEYEIGGEDIHGRRHFTRYRLPLLGVLFDVYAELGERPNHKARQAIERLLDKHLDRLRFNGTNPPRRERYDIRRPQANNPRQAYKSAMTLLEKWARDLRANGRTQDIEAGTLALFNTLVPYFSDEPGGDDPPGGGGGAVDTDVHSPEPESTLFNEWAEADALPLDGPEVGGTVDTDVPSQGVHYSSVVMDTLATTPAVHAKGGETQTGASAPPLPAACVPPSSEPKPFGLADPSPYGMARSALWAFTERGVERFGVSFLDDQTRTQRDYWVLDADAFLDALPAILERNEREWLSVCVRVIGPAFGGPLGMVQIDDCDAASVARLKPFAFLTLETSPGSYQAWLDLAGLGSAEEAQRARARILGALRQQKAEGNGGAYGSLRWPGTLNCKPSRILPDGSSPRVRLAIARGYRTAELGEIEAAGLLSDESSPIVAGLRELSDERSPDAVYRGWPDYERCLRDHPKTPERPDRHRADFQFAALAYRRGHSERDIAARLLEVSTKAKGRRDAAGYVANTVLRAVALIGGRGA